jgi:hypothetical protein|eukprot:scaffold838_cov218-Chaetoceros_neogracile.AAC.2
MGVEKSRFSTTIEKSPSQGERFGTFWSIKFLPLGVIYYQHFYSLRPQQFQQSTIEMPSITDIVPPGVVTGDNLVKLLEHARDTGYAIPAVNCTR